MNTELPRKFNQNLELAWLRLCSMKTIISYRYLYSITLFINYAGDSKHVIATAASLTILGVAMNIFAAAIIKMGNMSWEEMRRGLISLGSALAIVTLALILPKGIFIKSLALMDVAGAMLLLSQALKAFSSMSWEEIAKSLTALTVSLGVIIGAFVLLSKTSSIVDSLAFSVLAISIVMLAGALKTIGSMSLAQIGIALLGLAGAFTVIGVAATLLAPVTSYIGLAACTIRHRCCSDWWRYISIISRIGCLSR